MQNPWTRLMGVVLGRTRRDGVPTLARPTSRLGSETATLGENPRWDPASQSVYWIDIPQGRLHRYGMADGVSQSWTLAPEIGAIAIDHDGRIVVAIGDMLHRFSSDRGTLEPWCRLPATDPAIVRANDCAWTPDGSLLVATMDRQGREPRGRLILVAENGSAETLPGEYIIANGPAIDHGRRIAYIADSPRRTIYQFPLDAPERRAIFARFDEASGFPDGMAVDPFGSLWVAHYDGGQLSRWSADGVCECRIPMPVARPTALALLAGTPAEPSMIVTSARDKDGQGGGLYLVGEVRNGGEC